ncbi:hypothetical protein DFJ74DRAFT_643425 [Hyaloraphidium curvatum]|nr:hypothetical protein DFJ74DRAFT_643425 [Hyaloraphidium curvatum]
MAQSGALHGSQPSFPNSAFLPGHYSVGATAAGPQILYAKQTTQPLAGQQQLQLSQMQVQNLGSGSPVLTIPATFSPRSAPSSATTPPTGEPLPADAKYIYLSLLATVKTLRTAHVRLTSPSLTPTYYAQACDDLLLHFARPHAYIAPLAGLTSAVLLAVCEAGLRPGFEGVREKGRALIRLAYIEGVDVLEDSPFETGVELDGAPWLLGMDTQSLKQLYKRISGPKVREGQRDGTEELGTKPDGARPETPVDTKDGMARLRREQLSSASPAPSESSKPPITPVEPSKESLPTPMSAESAATRAAGVRTSPAPNEPAVVAESARPTVNMAEAEAVPIFDPAADLLSGSLEGLRGLLNIGLVRQDPLPLKADHRKLPPRIIAPNTEPWDIKHYPRYLPVPKIGTVVSASYPILPNVPDLKGQDVRFYLSPHLLQAIRQKHVMLQLWSRRLPANAVLGPNLQLPRKLEHPEPLVSLLLNTHSVPLLRRRRKPNSDPAHDKWEGRDRPGELPAQYLVPGNNSLEIWWNGNDAYMPPGATREETPRWVLTIEAAVKLTAEDCRLLIHHPWHSNAEAAGRERVARIFRRVADGDVEEEALSSAKLSLRCPVAGTRMAMPVIGRKCKHPNCFDLESWLEMNKTKLTSKEPEWKCLVPLCGAPCGLEDVVLDQWTVRLLRDVPKDAEEVDLFPDLTWRVPVPEIADRHVEVVDLSDSDAEVPKQPTTEAAEVEVEAPDVVQDMEIDGHGAAQRQDELPTGSGEGEAEAEAEDGAVEAAEEETPESIEQRRIAKEERHRQKAERKAARAARRAERAAATQLAEEAAAPTENQEAEAENPEPSAGNDVVVISSDDDEPAPRPESKRAKKVKSRTQRAPEVEVEVALKAPETVPKKGKKHAALREPAAPEQSCGAAMVDGQRDSEAQAGFDDRQSARSASLEPPGSQSSQNVPSFAEAYPDIAAEMVTDPDSMLPDVRHKARYHPSNGDPGLEGQDR